MAENNVFESEQASALGEEFFQKRSIHERWDVGRITLRKRYYECSEAVNKEDPEKLATVKRCAFKTLNDSQKQSILMEIEVMKRLTRQDMIHRCQHLYEIAEEEGKLVIIVERLVGDDLFQRISEQGGLPEDEVRKYTRVMLQSVITLHKYGCAHRNIKPENFRFSKNGRLGELRLSEFTAAYYSDSRQGHSRQLCGTPPYLPPEICTRSSYRPAEADMWSFGATVYVMFAYMFPFGGIRDPDNFTELYSRIQHENPKFSGAKWSTVSEDAKDFIRGLLKKNPRERLTAIDAVKTPFVVWVAPGHKLRMTAMKVIYLNRLREFLVDQTGAAENLTDAKDGASLPSGVLEGLQSVPPKTETRSEPPAETTATVAKTSRFVNAAGQLYVDAPLNDRWEIAQPLGKGAFGEVVIGQSKTQPDLQVAIKNITLSNVREEQLGMFEGECSCLRLLSELDRGQRLLRAYEVCEENNALSIVMELCRGGQLFQRIVKKGRYSESDAARDVRKMLEDISYLHSLGIAHRDIKPENFMFTDAGESGKLKIIDFGFAMYCANEDHMVDDFLGTVQYLPPEIVRRQYYRPKKADMWSFGVVVYVMFSGRYPFGSVMGRNAELLFRRIVAKEPDFRGGAWINISDTCKDFVRTLLRKDPIARPTAAEALKHPWLRAADLPTESLTDTVGELEKFQIASKFRVTVMKMVALQGIGGAMYNSAATAEQLANKDAPAAQARRPEAKGGGDVAT